MSEPSAVFLRTVGTALKSLGVAFEDRQLELLFAHFEAMVSANRSMNLTRLTNPQEAAVKHYADSLAILPWIKQNMESVRSILDIGTGAGFPAIPLAIFKPYWDIVALDGTGKKTEFVRQACADLHIKNLVPIHAHSKYFETDSLFDLVVTRAVGSLSKCLTLSTPHTKIGGVMVAFKTPDAGDERAEAEPTARALHLEALPDHAYELHLGNETLKRVLISYRKLR